MGLIGYVTIVSDHDHGARVWEVPGKLPTQIISLLQIQHNLQQDQQDCTVAELSPSIGQYHVSDFMFNIDTIFLNLVLLAVPSYLTVNESLYVLMFFFSWAKYLQ